MRKLLVLGPVVAVLLSACVLFGCSGQAPSAPATTLSASGSTQPPASSAAPEPAPSSGPQSGNQPQTPDAAEFKDMFRSTMFSFWVPKGYAATKDIPTDERTAWEMQGLLTWARQWETTGNMDETGEQAFSEQEIEAVSLDLLGYAYDMTAMRGHEAGSPVAFVYGFGPTLSFQPVDESYTETDGIITIEADIAEAQPGQENPPAWTIRYTFQYLPENGFPYRLLQTELVDGEYPAYY